MAKHTVERLVDDIDGSEAHTSVRFGIDGKNWSIDLNAKHEAELRAKLDPFVEVARRVRAEPGRTAAGRAVDNTRNPAIRQWALDEGVALPTRGRIAAAVQDAFDGKDVPALYAAVGLELELEVEPAPKRGRRRVSAEFSAAE